MALDHMAACKGVIEAGSKSAAPRRRDGAKAERVISGTTATVADDDCWDAIWGWRHRVAVKEESAAKSLQETAELLLDRAMIGPMGLIDAMLKLLRVDGRAPEIAMLLGSRRDNPEAATSPGRHWSPTCTVDHRRVYFIFSAVAVDGSARRSRNDRSATSLQRSPDEAIDERVLERNQGRFAGGSHLDEPAGIVAPRMRNGKENGKLASRRQDDRWGKRRHVHDFVPV